MTNKIKIEDTVVFKEVASVIGESRAKCELMKASKSWTDEACENILEGYILEDCFTWYDSVQGWEFWRDINGKINRP